MTKEETLFGRRLLDLADTAYQRGAAVFTDFLSLNEQNIYHSLQRELSYIGQLLYGGCPYAERQMLAFLPDAPIPVYEGQEQEGYQSLAQIRASFPITCLQIRPANLRFAEKLTHRDYLGALMNLGIERDMVGDLLIREEDALVICHKKQAAYIASSLTSVRRTAVLCEAVPSPEQVWKPKVLRREGSVSSVRLDALTALAFSISRSNAAALIEGGMAYVNGRLVTKCGYHPREGELISLRGHGKFRFAGEGNRTRKGRFFAAVETYI